ncbi:MAG TPA: AI-2E family transporter [Usitatibacteraceae bacterium]|nr:AI-2E family transporter [Usitatibacteraceae bacterium]
MRPQPGSRPPFLERIRARRLAGTPGWLSWNNAVLGVGCLVLGLLLWLLSPILAPFLAAAILAYMFDPLVRALSRRGWPRTWGTLIAVLLLLLMVALTMLIVMPLFYKEAAQLAAEFPNLADQLKNRLLPWLNQTLGVSISLDPASFRQFVTDNIADASGVARRVFSQLGVGGMAVIGFLINLVLIPVVFFYLLRDWPQLLAAIDAMIPRRLHARTVAIAVEIDAVLSEFLRGQVSVMLIMGLFYVCGLWLVGLEFALPVGLITGLLVFVPYLGSGSGFVLGSIAAFMQFPSMTGVVLVWGVFAAGQLLEGMVVTPWLVGERIGLHPVAVLFALLAFGQVFGFFGVLLALPASAAILVGLRHLKGSYQESRNYRQS